MSTRPDADPTLPSVTSTLSGGDREPRLLLTIVFHPDSSRIGETAEVQPPAGGADPWVLGRRSPAFARAAGQRAAPLQDAHVSRRAAAFFSDAGQLVLRRLPSSSRCRVEGRELHESVELDRDQLHRGVPILLGHSVVLLLRFAPRVEAAAGPAEITELRGSSAQMARLREQVARLADTGLDVMLRGETGTGKELVAAALHRASERCSGPMVRINMAAVPPGLAAATLFGNARGAFTGATRATPGFFNQARGGTLFMDEIGDVPPEVQPQLLRALQEREIQAVGGAISKVDVRVISATDAALEGEGCDFKAALRHRLAASEIALPPLREHPEDIGELLLHFLTINFRQLGCPHRLPTEDAPATDIATWADLFHRFLQYDWPGNVRELANFAGQVAVVSTGGPTLPDNVRLALQASPDAPATETTAARRSRRRNIRDVGEAEFDGALEAAGYEVAAVARKLGVSRQSIYRRMDESPRHRLAGQVPPAELEQALALHAGDARAAARDLKVSLSALRSRLRATDLDRDGS